MGKTGESQSQHVAVGSTQDSGRFWPAAFGLCMTAQGGGWNERRKEGVNFFLVMPLLPPSVFLPPAGSHYQSQHFVTRRILFRFPYFLPSLPFLPSFSSSLSLQYSGVTVTGLPFSTPRWSPQIFSFTVFLRTLSLLRFLLFLSFLFLSFPRYDARPCSFSSCHRPSSHPHLTDRAMWPLRCIESGALFIINRK